MIIDFHTHLFPDKIAGKTLELLKNNIVNIQHCETPRSYTDATLNSLKQSMMQSGIDYALVLPIATTVTQSTSINRFAAQVNQEERLFSFGSIHPLQENWEEELEHIAQLGLPGIKLHPEYQQVYIDSPQAVRVLKKAEELNLLVMLHAGKDIGMAPPEHCLPKNLYNALQVLDGDNIIAAHMGGWKVWDDVEKYLAGTPLYFDTSFSFDFMPREQFLRLVEKHTPERILFGTDSPWADQKTAVKALRGSGLSPAALDRIFFRNAQELLHLPTDTQ